MKNYKCIKGDGINFTEGNIYQLQENGKMKGDDGYPFAPAGCSTAVKQMEEHDFKFESISKFKNLDTFEQVMKLLKSDCDGIGWQKSVPLTHSECAEWLS